MEQVTLIKDFSELPRPIAARNAGGGSALDDLAQKMQARMAKLDNLVTRYESMLEEGVELPTDVKKVIDDCAKQVEELAQQIMDLSQKSVDQVIEGRDSSHAVINVLKRNEAFIEQAKAMINARSASKFDFTINARNTVTIAGIGSETPLSQLSQAGLVPRERRLRLLDRIEFVPTNLEVIPSIRESAASFTNNANGSAEGEEKSQSSFNFGLVSLQVVNIDHWIRISRLLVAHAPALAAYIEGRLTYGVRVKMEDAIINGLTVGSTEVIKGLMHASNSIALAADVADAHAADTLNRGKAKVEEFFDCDTIIVNPADWGKIERLKGSDGHYLFGSPMSSAQPILWGCDVITSSAQAVGKFWQGNLTLSIEAHVHEDVNVNISTEDGDNFRKGLATVLAGARIAFGVCLPDACVTGDLPS